MLQTDQDIRNRLLQARLPAMPQILLKLIELCQSDEAGLAELAELIANDAGMSARVLSIANSAAYHRGGRSVDLMQALSAMGSDMLKLLVISESVYQTVSSFPHSRSTDMRRFWKHALTTAVMAREIAKKMAHPQAEEAYLGGLLHDVGRLALLAAAPNEYSPHFWTPDDEQLCAIEQRVLQINHAEAGAWLIERWDLDSFLADSVLYHHEATARVETAHPLIRIVHLAHLLENQAPDAPLPTGLGAFCRISDEDLLLIQQGAAVQVEKSAAMLGIDLAGAEDPAEPQPGPATDPIQQQLGEEMGRMAVTAELGQALARQHDDAQLLDAARQSARILFELEDSLVLLTDESGQALVGAALGAQQKRLAQFSVPLSGGGGIAEAALQKRPAFLCREQGLLGLAEEQLLRALGSSALVCLPLVTGSRCLGVLVGGIPAWRVPDLKRNVKLLLAFGAKVATALDTAARERQELAQRLDGMQESYVENSRRVAHEVNNPLTIIKNYIGVLDGKLTRQEPLTDELAVLSEELDRVGGIIDEFAGAAPRVQDLGTDVNRIIQDLVRLFRDSKFLPSSIQIRTRLPEQASRINGPADTLKQILMNLVKNAIEALPRGGLIEIINKGQVHHDGRVYFALGIKDNGAGMPPEVLSQLFSPVRSAKAGGNRGLGLSIVNELVKKLGGSISCASTSAGTTFNILLPAREIP
jgi:putative nucleotidyltransferase with HDIG domain